MRARVYRALVWLYPRHFRREVVGGTAGSEQHSLSEGDVLEMHTHGRTSVHRVATAARSDMVRCRPSRIVSREARNAAASGAVAAT